MKPTNRSAYLEAFLETGSIPVGIIDTHTHMNDVYGTCMCVYEYEETIRRAKEQGIAGIWCSPHSDLFDGLARNGEITEMIPEAIAGTWSGEFEGMGVASGEIRTVVITTNGMDCFYNNEALTEVAYDYETNTITAKCGGLNVTMVWREEDNTISFTAVDDEQRMWIATLSKVEA